MRLFHDGRKRRPNLAGEPVFDDRHKLLKHGPRAQADPKGRVVGGVREQIRIIRHVARNVDERQTVKRCIFGKHAILKCGRAFKVGIVKRKPVHVQLFYGGFVRKAVEEQTILRQPVERR